jgi:hypothetical protein
MGRRKKGVGKKGKRGVEEGKGVGKKEKEAGRRKKV